MPHLGPDGFRFLRELADHNEPDWFVANKARYGATVRDPTLRLVEALGPALRKLSKHYVPDARPVGGSLSRINRDTRFTKDKRPYKTGLFLHFRHGARGEATSGSLKPYIEAIEGAAPMVRFLCKALDVAY